MTAGDSNAITRQYLDSILVEQRLIDSDLPDLSTELFGVRLRTPVVMPAFSHLPGFCPGGRDGLWEQARAAVITGALNFIGMCENDGFAKVQEIGAPTVRIVKPYADQGKILDQLAFAESCGAVAVGMDIDHSYGSDGNYDICVGERMGPVSSELLGKCIHATGLPFVVKGILSVSDAKKAVELGASALLISHHSGRMPFAVPPLRLLPEIREAVGPDVKLLVDCGIATGEDVFKALCLGADAAAVGRAMMPALKEKGAEGLAEYIEGMNAKLKYMMSFTGTASPKAARADVLHFTEIIR